MTPIQKAYNAMVEWRKTMIAHKQARDAWYDENDPFKKEGMYRTMELLETQQKGLEAKMAMLADEYLKNLKEYSEQLMGYKTL